MKKTIATVALTAAALAAAPVASAVTLDELVAEKAYADCIERQTGLLGDVELSFGSLVVDEARLAEIVCGAPEKTSPHLSQELRERKAAERKLCRVDPTTCADYVETDEVAGDE